MTTVAITQPTYLPWLGYFEQMAQVDYFVFLDTVQFQKQSWQSRNRIRDHSGNTLWLSVPVASHQLADRICDIRIAPERTNWRRKHIESVRTHLGGTPHLDSVMDILQACLNGKHKYLVDLNIELIKRVQDRLNIRTPSVRASELQATGRRADLLLAICTELGCERFRANAGSRVYLQDEEERFSQAGVTIDYQSWKHPEYHQRGDDFQVNLAWVDPISHLGWDRQALSISSRTDRNESAAAPNTLTSNQT